MTLIEEIRKRTGTTPMSQEDFDRHFGSLPTDDEGGAGAGPRFEVRVVAEDLAHHRLHR